MDSNILFFHTKGKGDSQVVRYSVAGRVTDNTIELCACRCSEYDQFNRKKGRAIAEGRLNCDKADVKRKFGSTVSFTTGDDGRGLSRAFLHGARLLIEDVEKQVQADRQKMITSKRMVFITGK